MPYIVAPFKVIPYEIPKVWIFQRWVEILVLITIVSLPKIRKVNFEILVPLSLLFVWTFFTSFQGVDFPKSFWGNPWRADGLYTLLHLFALSLVVFIYWDKRWFFISAFIISTSSFLLSLIVFFNRAWEILFVKDQTLSSPVFGFGNENFLAGYLLVTIPLALYLYKKSRIEIDKQAWKLVIMVQSLAIFFTFSLASILGLLVFFFFQIRTRTVYKVMSLIFMILVSISVIYYSTKDIQGVYINENRLRIYAKGILSAFENPFFGVGVANYDYVFEKIEYPLGFRDNLYVDKAHSQMLEILVTTGLLGLALYIVVLVGIFKKFNNKSCIYFSVLLLYLYHSQTNVISINEEYIFWILLGIALQDNFAKNVN